MKLSVFEQRLKELGYKLVEVRIGKNFSEVKREEVTVKEVELNAVYIGDVIEPVGYCNGVYEFKRGLIDFKELELLNKLIEEFFKEV